MCGSNMLIDKGECDIQNIQPSNFHKENSDYENNFLENIYIPYHDEHKFLHIWPGTNLIFCLISIQFLPECI